MGFTQKQFEPRVDSQYFEATTTNAHVTACSSKKTNAHNSTSGTIARRQRLKKGKHTELHDTLHNIITYIYTCHHLAEQTKNQERTTVC